jgi:phage terminase large subunit-like protein
LPKLTWLLLAGRGFGKTRAAAEAVRALVCGPTPLQGTEYGHIAIVAETAADARDVCVEGESGILGVHPKDFRPQYEPSKRRLTWPNGARATLYNATEPDQLRGPQHSLAWCDELAKWQYAEETWDQLQFGMRLGKHPRQIVATTPRPIPVLRRILADPSTVTTRGSTLNNKANLAMPKGEFKSWRKIERICTTP